MKLKEYLSENDLSVSTFASMIDITYSSVYNYIREAVRPSRLIAKKIEEATKGKVKAEDLRKINPMKKVPHENA